MRTLLTVYKKQLHLKLRINTEETRNFTQNVPEGRHVYKTSTSLQLLMRLIKGNHEADEPRDMKVS